MEERVEEYIKRIEIIIETLSDHIEFEDYDEDVLKEASKDKEALENLLKRYKELEKENERLKASHIITHNKVSDEEKANLFDVIDNSIDTYLEKTKPYWEQIMTKEKMVIEEAETIIDDMYQDRNKILQKTGETETEVIFDVAKLDEVKFTNLEFASVRALREIQSLRKKLKNSIPTSVIQKYKEKFLEDSKNEKVFMTQSTQINASLISFCDELLEERNK